MVYPRLALSGRSWTSFPVCVCWGEGVSEEDLLQPGYSDKKGLTLSVFTL